MEKIRSQYEEEKTMTLFKQMAIPVSITIVLTLAAVMSINYQSSKKDMIQSLYETTVNNISSLQNRLSQSSDSEALISSVIDAEFDSGYFKSISFTSSDDKFQYKQVDNDPVEGVPLWFIKYSKISVAPITSDVTSGWNMIGSVRVEGDTGIVYKALYKIFTQLIYIFSISVSFSLLILYIMLSYILRPLKGVQKQAEAVIRNEFIIQDTIPKTQEFADVVLGMNTMVTKVKAMFDKGNEELKRQKEKEYIDPITKLKNRKYLIDKLPQYLKLDASSKGGVNMMVSLSGVIQANEKIGHKNVDALFVSIAKIFTQTTRGYDNAIIARMNGTEFSLFIPDITSNIALNFAHSILKHTKEYILSKDLDIEETHLYIGLYEYNYQQSIGEVLSQSDNALAQAKFNQDKIHLAEASSIAEVMGKEAWREIISDAIDNNKFDFVSWPVMNSKTKALAHHALSLILQVSQDKTYYYGQFMAPANQAGLSNSIYEDVLKILFTKKDLNRAGKTYSLRLSYEFLTQESTFINMQTLFKRFSKELNFQLIIEIPDKLTQKQRKLSDEYQKLFQNHKIELGIFEFIGEGQDYTYLQELHPTYIKGESSYFLTQSEQSVTALKLITDSTGIELIATGVMDKESMIELSTKGVDTIQGRATDFLS